ncbi:MAG: 50S ribosomal protein L7/L12 [Pseudodesulfovibrio sp.]|uniref:50S ribosomal protein L7/L12 n=1 Tax=Pseudodesulfovibrio sp. TaxID=2035812 RepID=UPI001DE5D167|nr:50S ribosomal protein L7/L12 [Pseudodesulfovibrio sp.]MBV1764834.1 50S ribosomal protein L7/L12 [Pseudodesulfovibrio sp.]MBV1771906.1 50S ribosomal protein L7/L12 [Pseudodesulfovibrio sp.]
MSDTTKEQVVEFIANMTVLELSVFIKELEEKFGVSAAAPVAAFAAAPAAAAESVEEEKTEFDVVLIEPGANKIGVIKVVRALTSLGLKEAKAKVDETPSVILEAAAKDAANDAKKQLEEAGAKVEIK